MGLPMQAPPLLKYAACVWHWIVHRLSSESALLMRLQAIIAGDRCSATMCVVVIQYIQQPKSPMFSVRLRHYSISDQLRR